MAENEITEGGAAPSDVERARGILTAAQGKGAVSLDGRLIDAASIRQAQVMVDKAAQIESSLAARQ